MTGTYDPQLNLVYVGTGNPTPVLNGAMRPGDNPWTCSIVAINPDTGKLAWGFQASPHDTHDWDAAEVPVLVDGTFNGTPRKMVMQASRNGYFFVLDRTNGKSLLTVPFATVNWAKGIDKDGRPIPDPIKNPHAMDGSSRRTRAVRQTTGLPVLIARPACLSSALMTAMGFTFSNPNTANTAGPAPIMGLPARRSCAPSITRRARSNGVTNWGMGHPVRAS